jgi:hypothetical protein
MEYQLTKQQYRTHHLIQIDHNIYLENIISKSKKGIKLADLIKYLTQEKFEFIEAKEYVIGLVKNQVLVSEISPNTTGNDYIKELLSTFERLSFTNPLIEKTKKLLNLLENYQNSSSLDNYEQLILYSKKIDVNSNSKKIN